MGIAKIAGMAVKNGTKFVLNRGLGIMTERQVQASVLNFGRKANKLAAAGGGLNASKAASIMDDVLPKGIKRPRVLSNIDECVSFVKKETYCDDKVLNMFVNNPNVGGVCIASQKGGAPVIYAGAGNVEAPTLVHEFRHSLDADAKCSSKLRKLLMKLMPESILKKYSKKYGKKANKMYMSTQLEANVASNSSLKGSNIAEKLGTNEADLQRFLRSKIRQHLAPKNFKENIVLLKGTADGIKREIPAYAVTSRISGVADSKNVSLYQEEILKVVKEELKEQKTKYLKSLLRLKVAPTDNTVVPRPKGMLKTPFEFFIPEKPAMYTREGAKPIFSKTTVDGNKTTEYSVWNIEDIIKE